MNIPNRVLKASFYVLLFLFILFIIGLFLLFQYDMRKSDDQLRASFGKQNIPLKIGYIPFDGDSIRYISSGIASDSVPLLLFVHGTPGACDAFSKFLQNPALNAHTRMVSLDRPGHGFSNYGVAYPSIWKQVEALYLVAQTFDNQDIVLISHSYGGAIAAAFSLHPKKNILAHIMISPVVDPDKEIMFWFSPLPVIPNIKWLFSGSLQVSSIEKLTHESQLSGIEWIWDKIRVRTIVIHGTGDRLAPFENTKYLESKMQKEYLEILSLEGGNHLIPWMNYEFTKKVILDNL